jgi:hypothetical protein
MSENNDFDPEILRKLLTQQENARTTHNKILTMINYYTYLLHSNFDKFIINYSKSSTLAFFYSNIDMGQQHINSEINDSNFPRLCAIILQVIAKLNLLIERIEQPSTINTILANSILNESVEVPNYSQKTLKKSFFDAFTQTHITVNDFLHNNDFNELKPFIIYHNNRFIGNFINVVPTNEDYYECASTATQDKPVKRYDSQTFIKITGAGGQTILCIKPSWFSDAVHIPRIVKAVKIGSVNQILSKTSNDRHPQARRIVSADHCNLTHPMDVYRLERFESPIKTRRTRGRRERHRRRRSSARTK